MSPANAAQGHTPLNLPVPRKQSNFGRFRTAQIFGELGSKESTVVAVEGINCDAVRARADLISECVNSHAALTAETTRLRASNEALCRELERFMRCVQAEPKMGGTYELTGWNVTGLARVYESAKSALAAARRNIPTMEPKS